MIAMGSVLRDKHLAPKFKERALVESGYIEYGRRNDNAKVRKQGIPMHNGIKVPGLGTITYSMSTDYFLQLPNEVPDGEVAEEFLMYGRLNTSTGGFSVLRRFPQCWHPYYYMPLCYKYALSFLGIHTKTNQLGSRPLLAQFSPGSFRVDITAEGVIDAIKLIRRNNKNVGSSGNDVYNALLFMGFTPSEAGKLATQSKNLSLYETIADADEFASSPDIVKSCCAVNIEAIMEVMSPTSSEILKSQNDGIAFSLVKAQIASLLVDELNMMCSMPLMPGQTHRFIRLPTFTVDTLI